MILIMAGRLRNRLVRVQIVMVSRDIFIGGEGALPPLNFDNPKRSQIWYVALGVISRRVAPGAKCESMAINFWIFFKPFWDVL